MRALMSTYFFLKKLTEKMTKFDNYDKIQSGGGKK